MKNKPYRNTTGRKILAILVALTLMIPAFTGIVFADNYAATVLVNGVVYTVDGPNWDRAPQQSVAIGADGKIMFVGSNADAQGYIGANTQVIDLGGNAVFPGFVDTHVHPPGAAHSILFNINLFPATTIEEGLQIIRDFVEANPDLDAFWGSGFSMGVFSDGPRGPRKEWLDEICSERPIILGSSDGHSRWLNSAAFAANNITPETPAPEGGVIHLTDDGELWGNMNGAASLITMRQTFTPEQNMEALRFFQNRMHAWGFTSAMMDGTANARMWAEKMRTLEDAGEWHIRANQMLRFPHETDGNPTTPEKFDQLLQNFMEVRDAFADSQLINFTTAKFFMDGVIEGGMTAYMLEPYKASALEDAGLPADHRGVPRWNYVELGRHFDLLMREGIQSHIHVIGDAATRYTLHALEYAQALHPNHDVRNTLTHLHVVHPDDIVRMGELGIIGATQPYWHYRAPGWFVSQEYNLIGAQRAYYYAYPVRSLIDAGVVVTFSGDYPVTVANPFFAMEVSVTRNLPYGTARTPDITDKDDPTWLRNSAERITIREAVEAFTINGAYQLHREDEIGKIAVGMWADLVVLDQDIMRINPLRIDSTQVLKTIFAGEIVYELVTQRFDDVSATAWFYDYVMSVYREGIMVGTSTTPPLFSPNANINRGMIVTILHRLAGEPSVADLENPFTDVADGRWYADAVKWAAENGILNNVVEGTLFAPTTNITREQMATFVHNLAIYKGDAYPVMALIELGFYDTADISEAALAGVIYSYLNGIVIGRPGNVFDPQGLLTRAETAAMIQRLP